MTAKKRPVRERGRPIWVSAPSGRELDTILAERTAELQRTVFMPEAVEWVLAELRRLQALVAALDQLEKEGAA